jgi:hypothetical protein
MQKSQEILNNLAQQHKDDYSAVYTIFYSHTPYAELLCDLAPTLLARDPRLFRRALLKTHAFMKTDTYLAKYANRLFPDRPLKFSLRDFSISPKDSGWDNYEPTDLNYNRFNQVRSYLWNRWIKFLPQGREADFFNAVFTSLNTINQKGEIDLLMSQSGVFRSNLKLIEILEADLEKQFGNSF